jgi:hypothetical protein
MSDKSVVICLKFPAGPAGFEFLWRDYPAANYILKFFFLIYSNKKYKKFNFLHYIYIIAAGNKKFLHRVMTTLN